MRSPPTLARNPSTRTKCPVSPYVCTVGTSSSWNHIDSRDWLPGQAAIATVASCASSQVVSPVRYASWKIRSSRPNASSSTARPSTSA